MCYVITYVNITEEKRYRYLSLFWSLTKTHKVKDASMIENENEM